MRGVRKGSRTASLPGTWVNARLDPRQTLARDEQGQSLLEFALVVPVLILLVLGVIKFGITFNNYLSLTNATNIAAQQVSISRGQTTNPCTVVSAAVFQAAPFLTQANLKFTIALNGVTVANNVASPTCATGAVNLVANKTASVTVTYPCNLTLYGTNFANGCTMTAVAAEAIQ